MLSVIMLSVVAPFQKCQVLISHTFLEVTLTKKKKLFFLSDRRSKLLKQARPRAISIAYPINAFTNVILWSSIVNIIVNV